MRGGQAVSSFTDPFVSQLLYLMRGEDAFVSNIVSISIPFLFSSRAVQAHWGHLVRTGVVKREYKDVSLNNVITLGTRIRIVVLRVGSNFAWLFCNLFAHFYLLGQPKICLLLPTLLTWF
jgi:hypothetical protein